MYKNLARRRKKKKKKSRRAAENEKKEGGRAGNVVGVTQCFTLTVTFDSNCISVYFCKPPAVTDAGGHLLPPASCLIPGR